ncbi:GntR family transcriptional regulator, partial [Pseudonocardia acidicola]
MLETPDAMDLLADDGLPMAQRSSEGVARLIRKAILDGRLQPGQPLRERALAEELGISRTPIREALFILHGEGLIDLIPNRGATVRTITATDVAEIYALRAVLESHAAATAAEHVTDADLARLEEAYARLERIGDHGSAHEQADADLQLHAAIAQATGNQLLRTMIGQVHAFTVTYRSQYPYSPEQVRRANVQHRAIIDALRDNDAKRAEELMREHVSWSRELALAHFSEGDPAGPSARPLPAG